MEEKLKKTIKKTRFTPEEDKKLIELVEVYGEYNWNIIAEKMLNKNIRQCRERWQHYLKPIPSDGGCFTPEEDELLLELCESCKKRKDIFKRFNSTYPKRNKAEIKQRCLLVRSKQIPIIKKNITLNLVLPPIQSLMSEQQLNEMNVIFSELFSDKENTVNKGI